LPWEEDDNYIRSGHRSQEEFLPNTFRTVTLSEDEGIKAVIGKPRGKHTTEIVSYLFDKKKGWTINKAKAWFEEHQAKTKESFSWTGDIKEYSGLGNLIRGKALHPIRTVHSNEWPEVREYLEDELKKSAHTLAGKPLLIDHHRQLRGEVLDAQYEDGAIEYIAKLDDQEALSKIRDGKIKHCSVELEWKQLDRVNGVAPRNITFTGLSLLENFLPGDQLATVEIWEGIVANLKGAKDVRRDVHKEQTSTEPSEFIFYLVRDPAAFLEERFSTVWVDQTNGVQGVYGYSREKPDSPQPMALLFLRANGWDTAKVREWLERHPQYVRQSQPQPQPAPTLFGAQKSQPLQEAILPSQTPPSTPAHINRDEILALIPDERVWRSWSYGPQTLIRQLKHKLESENHARSYT